jgi:CheY-like chemotaxis protein
MTTMHDKTLPEVLLLEDDAATISILGIWLKGICNITAVTDGDSTLKVINENYNNNSFFTLMLFDINIPFPWNGLTLMEEIRKRFEPYRKIPFVAETAYAMPHDRERLLAAGFSDYLAKPLDREILIQTVQRFIARG